MVREEAESLQFLLILVYYERPNLIRNALQSIKDSPYNNWELYFIDDGSTIRGAPIVEEILGPRLMSKVTLHYINDTVEKKHARGGSRHGQAMNIAIKQSSADIVMVICDDDALVPTSLEQLNSWYRHYPKVHYSYGHVVPFNPETQAISPMLIKNIDAHWLNKIGDIQPSCQIDSSQVSYRRNSFIRAGLAYSYPQTTDLDADMYEQLYKAHGPCVHNGVLVQYKAIFDDRMGSRSLEARFTPRDLCYDPPEEQEE